MTQMLAKLYFTVQLVGGLRNLHDKNGSKQICSSTMTTNEVQIRRLFKSIRANGRHSQNNDMLQNCWKSPLYYYINT